MNGPPPDIRVIDASVHVKSKVLVDGVSCTAPAGAVTGLIGPNGSGKTTLLSLVARWRRPSSGTVCIGGRPVEEFGRREYARRVAVVEQHVATELDLTVEQVVGLGAIPHRTGWAAPSGFADVDEHLAAMRISHLRSRTWQTLSGGERQRTQVARALAQRPEVLVLDEPTNHLDPAAAYELLTGVRSSGRTALVALHDLSLAAEFCDRLVILDRGGLVAAGAPREVLTSDLLAEVYGLDAEVATHPRSGRPLIITCGTVERRKR
ncbi:ABC transporter ATP-binding protein [Gordonia sp. PDNC005]|uniref:ABC transporter ATP-binding protein n=1 Tax=unclassified Gordonia (in: high G+C Gram-positive bacteria) TaxID=2657482 RepID=UPI0019647C37|nr:ABC transporter ATP-binding protein [Gordonia sp. PDNC005]QRY61290.1 ABC transporter ATP-binding protein [Gordonia sp. PDNC005]